MPYLRNNKHLIVFLSIIALAGCGTHGSLGGYQYDVPKDSLDAAVWKAIASNRNIYCDTAKGYYNDSASYITITIQKDSMANNYTFRYYGDSTMWQAAGASSELFICYAYDKDHNGGSEGNGQVGKQLKAKLLAVFESEFVNKVDSVLDRQHTKTQ